MTGLGWLLCLLTGTACACAACPAPRPQPTLACPADTTLVVASGRRACVETLPVARGAYRECAGANRDCEPPPFRAYVAWGADHADAAMPGVSPVSARAYCAWAGRRLPTPEESMELARVIGAREAEGFRCAAEPGSPARARPIASRRSVSVDGLNRADGADAWATSTVFAAPLLGDSGEVTCARLRIERGADGQQLLWPAVGGDGERRYRFDYRAGTLRFTDPVTGRVEDWLVGDNEQAGGAIYVAGTPWIPGDLECTGGAPALRPLPRPWSRSRLAEAALADPEARRRALAHDDRVMFLREPDVAGAPPGRCVRAGLDTDLAAALPRASAALRIEAREGDRFYLITEHAPQGRVFVSAAEDLSGRSGLLPTGLLPLRHDAAGWHLGEATLHFDERTCEAERPRAAYPEANPLFRRGIFAAWITFVREHEAMYWVDPSGAACERVEIASPDGFPLVGTWRWTPRGSGEIATYHVTVDGDGVWLRLDGRAGAAEPCIEHYELRGLETHGEGIHIGGSTIFGSLAACERERPRTLPFAHRCPALAAASRPGPIPADSIAARGRLSGFLRDGEGRCARTAVDLQTSWSVWSREPSPPSLEGVWTRGQEVLDVYEWPFSKRIFRRSKRYPGGWIAAEARPGGAFALGDDIVYPTEEACRATPKR
ncbi:hypothetical protein [Sorangium sp. So ce1182]|uniref:hypothetical protein n=1 Tax=Sorangium sp. So ce1182 TaxID=3133334 RepID=UPI003F62C0D6